MSDWLIRATDIVDMADAVLIVMDYAREEVDKFTFGPLVREDIMSSGLFLLGDADGVADRLSKAIPQLTITRASA